MIEKTIWRYTIELHQIEIDDLQGIIGLVEEELKIFLAQLRRKLRERYGGKVHIHVARGFAKDLPSKRG